MPRAGRHDGRVNRSALVRRPSPRLAEGLVTHIARTPVDPAVALEQWPQSGVPDNPGAWLMAVAKRRSIDLVRRRTLLDYKHDEIEASGPVRAADVAVAVDPLQRGAVGRRGVADDDLPAGQGLEADGEPAPFAIRDGQCPMAHPSAPELLNLHDKRRGSRMAAWNGVELAGDVQHDAAVLVR